MLNKKVQITIAGQLTQLWFNKYGLVELSGYYGVSESEVLAKIKETTNNNIMALFSDVIYMGRVGYCLANAKVIDMTLEDTRLAVLETEDSELLIAWNAFLDAFGFKQKEEETDKKKVVKKQPQKKKS